MLEALSRYLNEQQLEANTKSIAHRAEEISINPRKTRLNHFSPLGCRISDNRFEVGAYVAQISSF